MANRDRIETGGADDGVPVRRGFRVEGRVQGVGFRWWTRSAAEQAGLVGRVWNCPDGSVRVDVEGSMDAVSALRALLETGPPSARVDAVVTVAVECPPGGSGFQIAGPSKER